MKPIAIVLISLMGITACDSSSESAGDDRPNVVAAVYPLEFVAEAVGGDLVDVDGITPAGAEPHDIELTASQVRDLTNADLLVYIGEGFQPAVEDVVSQLDDDVVFDVLSGKDLLAPPPDEDLDVDPHVWLDPTIMASIAEQLAARLADIDSPPEETFLDNAEQLSKELAQLDDEFADGLASCLTREIVTSHEAFAYLAARYDLDQVGISGIDPEAEPTPERLAEVAQFVEEHDISTIFFEELGSSEIADTLARETGADVDVLATLESPPDSGDYFEVMRDNLTKLRRALDCE
ncbi:MAG: metal ABC transporter substrate-binding protein [Actinomycetota bacterium]